jgi:hypothetical protein
MKQILRRILICAAALLGAAPAILPTGCHVVAEGARRDAQSFRETLRDLGDAFSRDFQNYRRVP